MRKSALPFVLAVVAGCGNSSSGGGDMAVAMSPHNFDQIQSQIFSVSCTFSTCHSPSGASASNSLDLVTDPYVALVGAPVVNAKAKGEGRLRVKPCDLANSFLVTKIKLTTDLNKDTDYGHHMPDVGGQFLTADQIGAISDWVSRGAQKSEPATVSGTTCAVSKDM